MLIETERLRIRPWRPSEGARVLDIYGRPEVVRWLGGGGSEPMTTLDEAARRIERWSVREAPPYGCWAVEVERTGTVAGTVLLVPVPDGAGEVEVGWHLHPDAQGSGYATEAARAVLRRGFDAGLGEIYAITALDNARSQAVCTRLGMTDTGVDHGWYGGSHRVFRVTAQEFG